MILLPQGPLELTQVKALLDALPVPIWLKDAQGYILAVNLAASRIAPHSEEQLLGTRGELFFDPQHLALALAHDQEAWQAKTVTVQEEALWFAHRKEHRWWRTYRQPIFDVQGQPSCLFSLSQDITRQKRAQAQVDGERRLLEMLNSSATLNEVLNAFALSYEQTFPGMMSSVLLLDADGMRLRTGASPSLPEAYSQAIDGVAIGMGVGSCGTAAFTAREVLVADITTDPLWKDYRGLAASHGLQACWSIPILSAKGQVLGTFANYHATPREPSADELQTIRRGAHMVGVAIEHHQTEALLRAGQTSLKESALHTQAILDNMADGVVTFNADGVIESFNKAASVMFGYPAVAVIGSDISILTPPAKHQEYLPYRRKFLMLDGPATEALTLEFEALRRDGSIFPVSLAVSKIARSGRAIGIGILRDITLSRQNEDEIRRLAFYDPLTELPNRRLLMDRLKQATATSARKGTHAAVMFLDLDHFKQLNDTLGHDMGDILLQEVARRLKSCVREVDSVARLGGDEFVVLMEAMSGDPQEAAMQAEAVAVKMLARLGDPYALGEHSHTSTPSIGIVIFMAQEYSVDDLLKKADVAMYQAKAAGRNTVRFFDPVTQAAIDAQAALEHDLRRGLDAQEFVLHYQPQVNGQGLTVGNEALVRWKHQSRGMVPPAQFIPLAETTGLIMPLGQWVLEAACAQLVVWSTQPATTRWTLSVNVSASQFAQADFVTQVLQALEKTGANPNRLKLELTESMLVNDVDDIIEKMHTIKRSGVGFSLDDFGTGYSSLSYLKRLPLDQLKIDQSFVRDVLTDPSDAVIARTVVALGHSLGLTVIAEGVETAEQAEFLSGIGCDAFQGYYYGRPGPAAVLAGTPA
jgi:diguanylate cyclase (GGDEF)-like protein/PAS domain S-box-containing protein